MEGLILKKIAEYEEAYKNAKTKVAQERHAIKLECLNELLLELNIKKHQLNKVFHDFVKQTSEVMVAITIAPIKQTLSVLDTKAD